MKNEQEACRKCGNCCKEGGPALHIQDLELIKRGIIPLHHLITIRKGELAYNPSAGKIQPVNVELVKIAGSGSKWDCCYYGEDTCSIYANRPHACRVLKCWDTAEILDIVEKDTLSRFDIIENSDPLIPKIKEHDIICPCGDLGFLQTHLSGLSDEIKTELEQRVRKDLHFRSRVIAEYQLKVSEELFYFGRPFFQILQPLGIRISESFTGIHLGWKE